MTTTALYASLSAFFYLALSVNVSKLRFKHRISLGVGALPKLERATRAHGNFAEYIPLILILMGLLEYLGSSALFLHAMGALLLIARLAHAYCLCIKYVSILRLAGATLTYAILFLSAFTLLMKYLRVF